MFIRVSGQIKGTRANGNFIIGGCMFSRLWRGCFLLGTEKQACFSGRGFMDRCWEEGASARILLAEAIVSYLGKGSPFSISDSQRLDCFCLNCSVHNAVLRESRRERTAVAGALAGKSHISMRPTLRPPGFCCCSPLSSKACCILL